MKLSHLLTSALCFGLAACQSTPVHYDNPLDNPRSVPPPGSVIELKQALTFQPNSSRNRVQHGQALGNGRFDRYSPWCEFYLYDSRESLKTARTLAPDRFEVVQSGQGIEYVQARSLDVAAVSFGMGVGFGSPYYANPFHDDVGPVRMKTTMRVRSDKQPQLHEISCSIMDDAWLQNYVSVNQIIKTLGEVATLHLPASMQTAPPTTTGD